MIDQSRKTIRTGMHVETIVQHNHQKKCTCTCFIDGQESQSNDVHHTEETLHCWSRTVEQTLERYRHLEYC